METPIKKLEQKREVQSVATAWSSWLTRNVPYFFAAGSTKTQHKSSHGKIFTTNLIQASLVDGFFGWPSSDVRNRFIKQWGFMSSFIVRLIVHIVYFYNVSGEGRGVRARITTYRASAPYVAMVPQLLVYGQCSVARIAEKIRP